MNLARRFAEFSAELAFAGLPQPVVEKARACVLNGYGIALGSHPTPFFGVAERAALAMDGERPDGATLLGSGRRSTVAGAALANAALFHGRAQEDTCGVAHFGAILLPLLTALVERGEGRMEDFLPALVAGYEIGGALESAYSARTTAACGRRRSTAPLPPRRPRRGCGACPSNGPRRPWPMQHPSREASCNLLGMAPTSGAIRSGWPDATGWRPRRSRPMARCRPRAPSRDARGSCAPSSGPSATSRPSRRGWAGTGRCSRSRSSPIPCARSTRRRCAPPAATRAAGGADRWLCGRCGCTSIPPSSAMRAWTRKGRSRAFPEP